MATPGGDGAAPGVPPTRTVEVVGADGLQVAPQGPQALAADVRFELSVDAAGLGSVLDDRYINRAGDTATGLIGFEVGARIGSGLLGGTLTPEADGRVGIYGPDGTNGGRAYVDTLDVREINVLDGGSLNTIAGNETAVNDLWLTLNVPDENADGTPGQPSSLNSGVRVTRADGTEAAALEYDQGLGLPGFRAGEGQPFRAYGLRGAGLQGGLDADLWHGVRRPDYLTQPVRPQDAVAFDRVTLGQQATAPGHAVRADRRIETASPLASLGFSMAGDGPLTADLSLSVVPPQDLRPTASPRFYDLALDRDLAVQRDGSFGRHVTLAGTLSASAWTSGVTGWGVTDQGHADFRTVQADELRVKAFTADVAQALAGSEVVSKSVGILASDFLVPAAGQTAPLHVEDLAGLGSLPIFETGDTLRLRYVSRDGGGLVVSDVWGKAESGGAAQTVTTTEPRDAPAASFGWSVEGRQATFTGTSVAGTDGAGGGLTYAWTFGDGATSTAREPEPPVRHRRHVHGAPGGHRRVRRHVDGRGDGDDAGGRPGRRRHDGDPGARRAGGGLRLADGRPHAHDHQPERGRRSRAPAAG